MSPASLSTSTAGFIWPSVLDETGAFETGNFSGGGHELFSAHWVIIRRKTYRTRQEARQDVFDYIEMFYNPKRKHVRNGMLSPVELERQQNI